VGFPFLNHYSVFDIHHTIDLQFFEYQPVRLRRETPINDLWISKCKPRSHFESHEKFHFSRAGRPSKQGADKWEWRLFRSAYQCACVCNRLKAVTPTD